MIYLVYDQTYDNWKEISFEQYAEHVSANDRRVMAVVVYAYNSLKSK